MLGFLTRTIGGAFTPLIDHVSDVSVRLAQKLALFLAATLCVLVAAVALTLAFGLWIAALEGPIVGCLAVACLYLAVAGAAVFLAMRKPRVRVAADGKSDADTTTIRREDLNSQVDELTAPLLGLLQSLGLRKEQLAVMAGVSVAKQLGPLPLVGLAIVAGFLIGRTFKSWRTLLSIDTITNTLASLGLFGFGTTGTSSEDEKEAA